MKKHLQYLVISLAILASLGACDKGQLPPASIGDHAVLEQLAEAFRDVGQSYPIQPQSMRPNGRKEFVEKVFKTAGYDYSATLFAVASAEIKTTNQDQRDLVELLFLPHKGLSESDFSTLYSKQELEAVLKIRADMR